MDIPTIINKKNGECEKMKKVRNIILVVLGLGIITVGGYLVTTYVSNTNKNNKVKECVDEGNDFKLIVKDLNGSVNYDSKTDEMKITVKEKDIERYVDKSFNGQYIFGSSKTMAKDNTEKMLEGSKENIEKHLKEDTDIDVKVDINIIK